MRRRLLLFFCLFLCACGATRKISQVGLRTPASDSEPAVISGLRTRVMQTEKLPASCSKDMQLFPFLAGERLSFPGCPATLVENFQVGLRFLKMEERTALEEAITSQCRSLGKSQFGDPLESMLMTYDSAGPVGRRAQIDQTFLSMEGDAKVLAGLKKGLEEVVYQNLPLNRWAEVNGEFLVPERDLMQLERLILGRGCRVDEQSLEDSYQMTRSMEELVRLLKESEQRTKLERFLDGVHKIIDEKIQEFFYPND